MGWEDHELLIVAVVRNSVDLKKKQPVGMRSGDDLGANYGD